MRKMGAKTVPKAFVACSGSKKRRLSCRGAFLPGGMGALHDFTIPLPVIRDLFLAVALNIALFAPKAPLAIGRRLFLSSKVPLQLLAAVLLGLSLFYSLLKRLNRGDGLLPLPPGPPGEWFAGHFRVIPYENPQFKYIEWGNQYNSDVLSFNVFGRPVVVLNSVEAAEELLDKHGANYQDRPRFVMYEVMGWGITLTFLQNGPQFRLHRKLIQGACSPSACKNYRDIQIEEMRTAVRDILDRPQKWELLIRKASASIVLRIGFGVRIRDDDDEYIKMADDANFATTQGGTPASTIGDYFPIITYLPNWLARSAPLRHARDWGFAVREIHDRFWEASEKEILSGNAEPSFMKTHLEAYNQSVKKGHPIKPYPADIQGAAGAMFIAGGNTTWSTIMVCLLQLLLNPAVKEKARCELDALIGNPPTRLPTFSDLSSLPYLHNIVQETYRLVPLSPVGVPHRSIAADTYKGLYSIPAGATVYANARAMCHDSRVYSNPAQFNPDRYFGPERGGNSEPYPKGQFGFGRRACPGQHLATNSILIFLATLIACVDLELPRDNQGNEIRPQISVSNGLSSHPDHYDCVMKERSQNAKDLIFASVD